MTGKKDYAQTKRTYGKRRYDYRKAHHLCTDCGAPLDEDWPHIRCADCMKRRREQRRKPAPKHPKNQHGPNHSNYKSHHGQWWTYVETIPRGKMGEPVTCHGCYHRIQFDGWSICNYCHDMQQCRPCPVEGCTEYRTNPRGKRHTIETSAQKEERKKREHAERTD